MTACKEASGGIKNVHNYVMEFGSIKLINKYLFEYNKLIYLN